MQISAAAVYVCCCSSLQFHCLKVLNAKPKVKLDGTPKCMTTWPYFSTHSMKVQENQWHFWLNFDPISLLSFHSSLPFDKHRIISRIWGHFEHFADDVVCRMAWLLPGSDVSPFKEQLFRFRRRKTQQQQQQWCSSTTTQHRTPPTSPLKIEFSTFLFQFAATNSDVLYHNKKGKDTLHRSDFVKIKGRKYLPFVCVFVGKNGLIYGCPRGYYRARNHRILNSF